MNRSTLLPERREAAPARLKRRFVMTWDNLSLREKGVVVVSLPLTALLVAAALGYTVGQQQQGAVRWARQAQEVETTLQTVFTEVSEATTGLRGFLLTDEDDFLAPYADAVAALPGLVAELEAQVRDDPAQAARERLQVGGAVEIRDLLPPEIGADHAAHDRRQGVRLQARPDGVLEPARGLSRRKLGDAKREVAPVHRTPVVADHPRAKVRGAPVDGEEGWRWHAASRSRAAL